LQEAWLTDDLCSFTILTEWHFNPEVTFGVRPQILNDFESHVAPIEVERITPDNAVFVAWHRWYSPVIVWMLAGSPSHYAVIVRITTILMFLLVGEGYRAARLVEDSVVVEHNIHVLMFHAVRLILVQDKSTDGF
jgi:hypothetical protein